MSNKTQAFGSEGTVDGKKTQAKPKDEQEITGVITVTNTSQRLKLAREYTLIRKLGAGGMGEVHLGEIKLFGKKQLVAVKILNKAMPPAVDSLARFHREAELLRKVKHNNIVQFYDYWENEDFAYLVMEFVDGENLEKYRQENGTFDHETLLTLMLEVLRALQYMLEEHSMFHRDIKPNNIQVMPVQKKDGLKLKAMLIDFGNAKIDHLENPEEKSLTMMSSQMAGTPGYTPPSVDLDVYSEEDDVFSVACTMMYCLLGENPFEVEGDPWASMQRVREAKFSLGAYEGTMLGQWIRINVSPVRNERMSLAQAIHSLERILKDDSYAMRKATVEFVRLMGSDKALMAQMAKPETEDLAHSATVAFNPNAMSQMTNPRIKLSDLPQTSKPAEKTEDQKKQEALIDRAVKVPETSNKKDYSTIKIILLFGLFFLNVGGFVALNYYVFAPRIFLHNHPLVPSKPLIFVEPKSAQLAESTKMAPPVKEPIKAAQPEFTVYKSVKDIYSQVKQAGSREQLLLEAKQLLDYAQANQDKQLRQQAEWRYLAILYKAPVKAAEKLPVIKELFSLYCQAGQLKEAKSMAVFYQKYGAKEKLTCQ